MKNARCLVGLLIWIALAGCSLGAKVHAESGAAQNETTHPPADMEEPQPARATAPGTTRDPDDPGHGDVQPNEPSAQQQDEPAAEHGLQVPDGQVIEGNACANGCTVESGEPPSTTPGGTYCSRRIAWESPGWIENVIGNTSSANLRSDSQGNVYYVGDFANEADFGTGELSSYGVDAVIVKLGPHCEVLWVKQLHAMYNNNEVNAYAIAVGPEDQLIVAGSVSGLADFGLGAVDTRQSYAWGLVLAFDAEGTPLWQRTLQSTSSSTRVDDIGVSASGKVVVSGRGSTSVHFDGAAVPEEPAYSAMFVATMGPDGAPGSVDFITGYEVFGTIAVGRSGWVAVTGYGDHAKSTGALAGFDWSATGYDHFLMMLDANGALAWSRHLDETIELDGLLGYALDADRDDNLIVEHGRSNYEDSSGSFEYEPEFLRKIDSATGEDLWIQQSQYAATGEPVSGDIDWYGNLASDTHGNIVHTDEVVTGLRLDGETYEVQGERDFLVRKRDPNGALLWTTQLGGEDLDVNFAVATDVHDGVWIGHTEEAEDFRHGAVVITKLVP